MSALHRFFWLLDPHDWLRYILRCSWPTCCMCSTSCWQHVAHPVCAIPPAAGDPFIESNYGVHSREFEIGVLQWFARLWEIEPHDFWGYITNCGTGARATRCICTSRCICQRLQSARHLFCFGSRCCPAQPLAARSLSWLTL